MKKFKFTINGNDYQVNVHNFEDNTLEVEVNGSRYAVQLERKLNVPKTPKLVRRPATLNQKPQPLAAQKKVKTVMAPLPGTIMELNVKEGDEVKTDQCLLLMEAMKMENRILAEADGTITAIKVSPGENVLQGQVLIELS